MWRRETIRIILALNWSFAGLACGMVIYGHDRLWSGVCKQIALDEMRAEGVSEPLQDAGYDEWYRRGDLVRAKLKPVDRMGYYGWLLAMSGFAATAVGLMIAFPKPLRTPTPIRVR